MIVLKFICLVYLPFVTFGNTLDFTQSRTIILCEDEKRNISCAYGNLSIEKVIFPQQGSRCNTLRYCDDKATHIQSQCNGQKWCEVYTNAFIHGRCTKVPRHIVLNYACSHRDGPTRSNTKSVSRDSIIKPSINRTSTKHRYDEGTGNVLHGTCLIFKFQDTKYYMQVKLDNDLRVLIYDERENKSVVLCPNMWTDTHATIVCRQFNLSNIGFAITVTRRENYKQLHVHVNCSGNESTLLLCRFDRLSQGFCENGDAAIRCTTLNTNPVSSTEVIVPPAISSNMTGTEIGVISSIVVIATTLFVIFIIYRKNKKWKHNSESNISEPMNYQNLHRNDGLNETSNLYVDANATNGPYSRLAASVETDNTSYSINDPQRGNIFVDHLHGLEGNMENNYFSY
ncbi:uncharacterized protein LOC134725235 isoform X5 [Mytilus trossulus]|uniref:uncharacterized protein LOC134725235 isoform X5 n=1 Tax=Mytilus trossulus TaxID=6551 RepID=UPI003007C25C